MTIEWWPAPRDGEIVPDYPPQDLTRFFVPGSLQLGADALRMASGLECWRVKGHALGANAGDLDDMLAEVEADRRCWPWSFDVVQELDRRLMLRYAELRERPAPQLRDAAMQVLVSVGLPFMPADVDRYAWAIERLQE